MSDIQAMKKMLGAMSAAELTVDRLFEEMGLGPRWVLREERSVAGAPEASAPAQPSLTVQEADMSFGVAMPASVPVAEPVPVASAAQMDWATLNRTIRECTACGLCRARQQAVPGVGDENASWLFIGEGPGAEEDSRGEPFVGQAGRLLDAMLAAIDLQRGNDVYIANAVKCRPPGNRTPESDEMAACFPYLQRQIALLKPRLIVLLGRAAVHSVLGAEGSLASLRGKRLAYRDAQGGQEIPVVVTYHPAYLLRNLPDKAKAWEDLCRARALMRSLRDSA